MLPVTEEVQRLSIYKPRVQYRIVLPLIVGALEDKAAKTPADDIEDAEILPSEGTVAEVEIVGDTASEPASEQSKTA